MNSAKSVSYRRAFLLKRYQEIKEQLEEEEKKTKEWAEKLTAKIDGINKKKESS